jgi:hypothetical protein
VDVKTIKAILIKHAFAFPNLKFSDNEAASWLQHFTNVEPKLFDIALGRAVRTGRNGFFPTVGQVFSTLDDLVTNAEYLAPEVAFSRAMEIAAWVQRDKDRKHESKAKFNLANFPALRECLNNDWIYDRLVQVTRPYNPHATPFSEWDMSELKRVFISTYKEAELNHAEERDGALLEYRKAQLLIGLEQRAIEGPRD